MNTELEPLESQEPDLSLHKRIGDILFAEALRYRELAESGMIVALDNFTSYRVHPPFEGIGKLVSIHFRVHMDELKGKAKLMQKAFLFAKGVGEDLRHLAVLLNGDLKSENIGMICGLTEDLFKAWGERNGFRTVLYTNDPELIRKHNQTIADDPHETPDRLNPLHVFSFDAGGFIKRFNKEDSG